MNTKQEMYMKIIGKLIASYLVAPLIGMLVWNWAFVDLGLPIVTFWHMLALSFFVKMMK